MLGLGVGAGLADISGGLEGMVIGRSEDVGLVDCGTKDCMLMVIGTSVAENSVAARVSSSGRYTSASRTK